MILMSIMSTFLALMGASHQAHLMEHTYLSQLIRFARVCNKVEDFNDRNSIISRKLLKQGFLFHKLMKTFAKFYNRRFDLVQQFNSSLINLIEGGISHPHF